MKTITTLLSRGRRDAGYPAPRAQIPACGTTAPGSSPKDSGFVPQSRHKLVEIISFVVFALGGIVFAPLSHAATTFTVTRFDDIGVPDPRDSTVCQPGNCTLREAVFAANATPGADTVLIPAGVYQLRRFTTDDQIQITDDVTIKKTGTGSTAIVDAGGAPTSMRAFDIFARATFVSIGVRNGFVGLPNGGAVGKGGGILVEQGASLTMTGGFVSGNTAAGTGPGGGGGIWNQGTLTLNKVLVENNHVELSFGAGIATGPGVTTINNSVIRNNNAEGFGGGLSVSGDGSSIRVTASLIQGNTGFGGGVFVQSCGGFTAVNSTISGNTSTGPGGAIRTRNGFVFLLSSTVTKNLAHGQGGGIAAKDDDTDACPTKVNLGKSIVAGNADNNGGVPVARDLLDENGSGLLLFFSGANNIIGDGTLSFMTPLLGDQIGVYTAPIDPRLAPLAKNGGPTLTHALLRGSPAVDAVNDGTCPPPTTDQRGVKRPRDGNGDGGPACDVGAFER